MDCISLISEIRVIMKPQGPTSWSWPLPAFGQATWTPHRKGDQWLHLHFKRVKLFAKLFSGGASQSLILELQGSQLAHHCSEPASSASVSRGEHAQGADKNKSSRLKNVWVHGASPTPGGWLTEVHRTHLAPETSTPLEKDEDIVTNELKCQLKCLGLQEKVASKQAQSGRRMGA